jgi:hypothetical protein
MDKNWKKESIQPSEDAQKTQIVPPFAQSDATQIVKPPISDATQIVKPPISDATQIVKPPVHNNDLDGIAEGIMMEEEPLMGIIVDDKTVIVKPPVVKKHFVPPIPNYDEPNRNMTVIITPQPKPMETESPPMQQRREMGGGERNDSIPAFVKWIGGLALLVLLCNLGYCAVHLN